MNLQDFYGKLDNHVQQDIRNAIEKGDPIRFQMPRQYGYAVYELIGGKEEWRKNNSNKFYIHLEEGVWKFHFHGNGCICLAAKRIGGYNGQSNLPTLEKIWKNINQLCKNNQLKHTAEKTAVF